MKTNRKRFALFLAATLLLGLFAGFSPAARAAGVDITEKFTDPNFRAAVYEVIGKDEGEVIWDSDVAGVEKLDVGEKGIESLAGLEYFTNLTELWCSSNQLSSLPDLPTGLIWLSCGNNPLAELPALPSSLEFLLCYDNQLASLPTLPSGLIELVCGGNQLTALPALPSSLGKLSCPENRLTTLPDTLPSSLWALACYRNQLTALPEILPIGLYTLFCSENQLTSLPMLPSGLAELICFDNQLASLPILPSGLETLACGGNQLTALPALPSDLFELSCVKNHLTELDVSGLSKLKYLFCSYNDMMDSSDVKGFTGTWDGEKNVFDPQRTAISPWAVDAISDLDNRRIIPYELLMDLQNPIRRDEFTALLVNMYLDAPRHMNGIVYWGNSKTPFLDIEYSSYKFAIDRAYTYGLIDGTSPTKFTPAGLLTREQTAKLLYTLVDIIDGATLGNTAPNFTDTAAISSWAVPYVAYCQQNNIMQGTATGKFDPQGNLTREQAMLVCERLIVQYGW